MKSIYITGIAGLLGNAIVKELKDQYLITGADRNNVDIWGCKYEQLDLLDFDSVRKSIQLIKPDVIIHAAACVNVDMCESNSILAKRMNVELTKVVVEVAKEIGAKIIYISSDAVFDGKSEKLYDENDLTNPINEYAKTKLLGERVALEKDDTLVLRTNFYGLNIRDKKSIGEWVVDALKQNETINMFEDIFFSPLLTSELSSIIGLCIEKDLIGIYHACATGAISKYEFGVAIKEIFGIESGIINRTNSDSADFIAKRSKHMGMSNKKIREALNISISTPRHGIEKFKRIYENQCKGDVYENR